MTWIAASWACWATCVNSLALAAMKTSRLRALALRLALAAAGRFVAHVEPGTLPGEARIERTEERELGRHRRKRQRAVEGMRQAQPQTEGTHVDRREMHEVLARDCSAAGHRPRCRL